MSTTRLETLLFDSLPHLDAKARIPHQDRDTFRLLHEQALDIAQNVLAPLRQIGDQEGCRLVNGRVVTPKGTLNAWKAMAEAGWTGMGMPEAWSGGELDPTFSTALGVLFSAHNQAFMMTQGLTQGAAELLAHHAHEHPEHKDMIRAILHGFAIGSVTGTMNLTEPQCGTDLGLIRTTATPVEGSDTFRVKGQKIWISSGDHDLSGCIAHLVLAREPGLPDGMKGISLFLVPSVLWSGPEGWSTTNNTVSCIGLEHKMGLHASPTCVMAYDNAWGIRIGEQGRGVQTMFTMMNAARLLVAGQGLAGAWAAWEEASRFADTRRAGRALSGPQEPQEPADTIRVHADVRRMDWEQQGFLWAGTLALLWGASLLSESDPERAALRDLLIPVLKSTLTDKGMTSALTAQQLMGGMGYVRDGKVESIVRDLRITTVYEGTNGIQALDLIGRKLAAKGGAGTRLFLKTLHEVAKDSPVSKPLTEALTGLEAILGTLMAMSVQDREAATGVAVDVQEAFGLCLLGGAWAAIAKATPDQEDLARFWCERHLPMVQTLLNRVRHTDWVQASKNT